jgi:hypothetical protein
MHVHKGLPRRRKAPHCQRSQAVASRFTPPVLGCQHHVIQWRLHQVSLRPHNRSQTWAQRGWMMDTQPAHCSPLREPCALWKRTHTHPKKKESIFARRRPVRANLNDLSSGANKPDAFLFASAAQLGVLRKEAVARVDGVHVMFLCKLDKGFYIQITGHWLHILRADLV